MLQRDRASLFTLALAGTLGMTTAAPAQEVTKSAAPPKPVATQVRELSLDPAPEPRPALRYRLFPLASERTPGDAAPVYLRLRHETKDARMEQIREKADAWLAVPLAEFPTAEAREFLDTLSYRTDQLRFGARRQTCDWNYTLPEQAEHAIEILLPDAQEMRKWGSLLAIKARCEVAERRYDEAVRTCETGLAFAEHVAEGPFAINFLVAAAIAQSMLDRVEELIAQPGAPNLYWALSALPRPVISLRRGAETEQRVGEMVVPEVADLDRPRTKAEWSSRLDRLIERTNRLAGTLRETGGDANLAGEVDPARFKAESLPAAREYLRQRGLADESITDDRALVLSIAWTYREVRDDTFKTFYLPFAEATALQAKSDGPGKSKLGGPAAVLAALDPASPSALALAQLRPERRVAALRVVEALRMTAASDGGKLPASLDAVTIVPIPPDPATGKPFEYRLEGDAAFLVGPTTQHIPPPGISYRITIRK